MRQVAGHANACVPSPACTKYTAQVNSRSARNVLQVDNMPGSNIMSRIVTQSSCSSIRCNKPAACTGLDARAAAIVMRVVRNINQTGKAMAITIHQPGIHIFEVSCRAQHASAAMMSRPCRWQIVCRVHSPLARCRNSRPAVRGAFSLISHRIGFRQKGYVSAAFKSTWEYCLHPLLSVQHSKSWLCADV